MPAEWAPLVAISGLAALIAWPAIDAWRRRAASRESSAVAAVLNEFADELRHPSGCPSLAPEWRRRIARLRPAVPEVAAFELALAYPGATAQLQADAARRLALRLRRRIAFERKMLARTASGLRRGALAAAIPPLALLGLAAGGMALPLAGLILIALLEVLGCWLLRRLARVGI